MNMLKMSVAPEKKWEDAYDVFYRAHRKLISEGKGDRFGGMTEENVKGSMRNNNRIYLFYRRGDERPVAAISILLERNYKQYKDVLEKISYQRPAILNAIAVRPELWGQGYGKEALHLCLQALKGEGIDALVGTVHPQNGVSMYTLNNACQTFVTGREYVWTTPKGRNLRRKCFALTI